MIPKILHIVWVGTAKPFPRRWVESWQVKHPDWSHFVWTDRHIVELVDPHGCVPQVERCIDKGKWEGVADILRYAILHHYGGVYVDADSECLQPIPDVWRTNAVFACYESEAHFPGQVSNGFIGAVPGHPLFRDLLQWIAQTPDPLQRWSPTHQKMVKCPCWKSLGPQLFTRVLTAMAPPFVAILPSETFIPKHRLDTVERTGPGVYARHFGFETQYREAE